MTKTYLGQFDLRNQRGKGGGKKKKRGHAHTNTTGRLRRASRVELSSSAQGLGTSFRAHTHIRWQLPQMPLHSEVGELGADRRKWSETKSDPHNTPTTQYSKIRVLLILWFLMQSNRALWPKRNKLVKHCYYWFQVNIKPVPRCRFNDYHITRFKVSQHLTTCSMLGPRLCLNQSRTLISVKRSVGTRPTKNQMHRKNLKQHICVAGLIEAAPCTASISYFNFNMMSHICAIVDNFT